MLWTPMAFTEVSLANNKRLWQCFQLGQQPQSNRDVQQESTQAPEKQHSGAVTSTAETPPPLTVEPPVPPLTLHISEATAYLEDEASPTTIMSPHSPRTPIMSPHSPRTPCSKAATPKPPKIDPPSFRLLVSATSQSGWTTTNRALPTDFPSHMSSDARLAALSWLKMCEAALDDELGPETPGTPFDAKYWELPHPQAAEKRTQSWWSKLRIKVRTHRVTQLRPEDLKTHGELGSRSKGKPVAAASSPPTLRRSTSLMTSHLDRRGGRHARLMRQGSTPAMKGAKSWSYNAQPI